MDAPPQVSEADLAATPASVLALLRWQGEQIVRLTARVAELEAKLARLQGATPANSSKPPSSTHPHDKPPPSKPKSTRKRGGQPVMKSTSVRCCRRSNVSKSFRSSRRHVVGAAKAARRRRSHPAPSSGLGSSRDRAHRRRISAASTCLLVRMQHLRRTPPRRAHRPSRPAAHRLRRSLDGVLSSVEAASGAVHEHGSQSTREPRVVGLFAKPRAEAVKPAYDELARRLPEEAAPHIDESPTKEGPAKAWVWAFVAANFTFFACRTSRGADVLQELLTDDFAGVIHCDRAHVLELRPTTAMVLGSSQARASKLSSTAPAARTNGSATISCGPRKSCSRCGNESATARCPSRRSRTA